jgi:hypothetical protein
VPLPEIAAVLRVEFKLDVTWEELDRLYGDEILIGRAYVMEKISKKTVDSALDGSATAQKVMFDVARDADQREARQESAKGRQIREIRLTVLKPDAILSRSEPPRGDRKPDISKAHAALAARRAAKEAALAGAGSPRGEAEGLDAPAVDASVGRGNDAPRKVQRRLGWERFRQVPLVRDDGGAGARPESEQLDGVRPRSDEELGPVGEEAD